MAKTGRALAERMGALMSEGDVEALEQMYADDAALVRYSAVTSGNKEIGEVLASALAAHGEYDVISIDQFRDAGELIMWDATVRTQAGVLQTTHVVLLDEDGLIRYHVPGIRGYWGM